MFEDIKQQFLDLIEKPLQQEGCELVDVVLSRYRNNWTLRLFIFSDNGTTIYECARISRIVRDIIEGTTLFESGYTLEVSSPGLDRPLTTARDFKHRVGEKVRIEFVDPHVKEGTAEIVSATDREVQFKNGTGVFTVGLAEIEKATIVF
ncbi:MAG: ribosome maturation factor RimP [Candidatus Zixiibacteriota bacterium]|nr:MAG: ribosome maturation factor RimP [candidate division Zixibacteria bacterium]